MTNITELAQSLKAAAEKYKSVWGIARYSKAVEAREKFHELVTPANVIALVEALEKAQQRIEELESDLSEWTDCKHDGATYYDMSGQERCGRCGADI
ncbi:TPA: ead/Ea22-like family protein [Klebsiella pneumoniae]|nr:ead/Ea22-like family protein [Klebsiella pneumoniae]